VLERAFEYWRNIDKDTGDKVVAAKKNETDPSRRAGHPRPPRNAGQSLTEGRGIGA